MFSVENSSVKFDQEIELKWSVKYFKKIFLKYDKIEIDVTDESGIKIKNVKKINSRTTFYSINEYCKSYLYTSSQSLCS